MAQYINRAYQTDNNVQDIIKNLSIHKGFDRDPRLEDIMEFTNVLFQMAEVTPGEVASLPLDFPMWKYPQIEVFKPEFHGKKIENPALARAAALQALDDLGGDLNLFTDGSKKGKNTGCGFYDSQNKTVVPFSINNSISIYSAELLGIREALKHALERQTMNKKVVLGVDSLSALLTLQGGHSSRPDLARDIASLQAQLLELGNTVVALWIPSHVGVSGNELADLAARTGLSSSNVIDCRPSASELNNVLKQYFKDERKVELECYAEINKNTPAFILGKMNLSGLPRSVATVMLRLATHTWRSKYIKKI